jgi:serine protease Do
MSLNDFGSPLKARASRMVVAALLLGTAIGAGGVAWTFSSPSFAAAAPLSAGPITPQAGFAPLVARVKPAVVEVTTVSQVGAGQDGAAVQQMPNLPAPFGDMFRHYFDQQGGGNGGAMAEQRALGSGFIVDPAGYIVTNNHVVDGAREVSVTLTGGDKYKAQVIGRDSKTDLALLKIDAGHSLPYVAFGDSDNAHEGDWVIAVGNPYGLGGTVTAGIVSAHGRDIHEGPYDDFMQIDAPINPGNSGGPLFNQSGQVVGIDTAIYSPSGGSVGIGFAIPSNVAKTIVAQLRDHGKVTRGWLGVQMQALTPALAKAAGLPGGQGVLVDSVTDGSPAAHADLRQGDVITAFDGKPIRDIRDFALAVANTQSGSTASATVWRDNHSRDLKVTIGTEDTTRVASAQDDTGGKPVGLSLEALTPYTRDQLNLPPMVSGVLVGQVTPGSDADESGVQAGDIIEQVAGNRVTTPDQVADSIHAAQRQKKQAVSLLVMRNGMISYLGLQLEA